MKIYRAETGTHVHWSRNVSLHTLDEFKQELEQCTGVPVANQILMTSFGQQVKQDQLQDIQRATGNDEYIIICYDRHYLGASQEEISTLLDMDIPSIQPELIPFDPSQQLKSLSRNDSVNNVTQRAELFLDLFAGFNAHSQELMDVIAHHAQLARTMVEEQKAQRMALNVAFENLDMHYLLTQQNFEAFQESADREHDKQITLLKNIDTDANILRTIRIHPELAHFGTSSNTKNRLCLIDFVDMEQLDRSREDASKICQLIEATMQQLRPVVSELKMHQQDLQRQIDDEHDLQSLDTKLVDILETKNKAQFIRDKIKRDIIRIHQRMSPWLHTPLSSFLADLSLDDVSRVSRIDSPSMDTPLTSTRTHPGRQPSFSSTSMGNPKEIFEAIYRLAVIHAEEYLSKLADYETTVRQALLHLVTVKRQSIHSFLKSMNVISHLQSDIMHSQQVLNASKKELAEFQAKHETSQLEATRHILFGYGALLIEIVRRKEFSRILKENAHAITDVLGDFKEKEDHRREYFRHDISNALPFKIPVLNKAAPQCEISASSVEESIPQIAHEDIIDFVSLLDQSYAQAKASSAQLSSRSQGKDFLSADDPRTKGLKLTTTDTYGQSLLNLLNSMNMQLDGLASDFMGMILAAFYKDGAFENQSLLASTALARQPNLVSSRQLNNALQQAQDKVKKYEARITSLEATLRQQDNDNSMHPSIDTRPATIDLSNDVSSVILAGDMSAVLSVNTESTDDLTKAHEEIARLKSMIQQRDVSVAELRERLEKNQQEHEQYRDQAEHEKEELRLQIHECEQLLEDERQAYEENTKSFLKEAQIKDNLADIRIADLESDWKVKVTALTEDLGTTRQNQDDLKQRNHELETHLSTTGHQMERLEREYERYKKDTTAAKEELEMKMEYLLVEMNNSDAAKEEIRQKLSQAREMVTKAENDWFEKNNALEKLKQAHEHACDTVNNLLLRLNPNFTRTLYTGDQDIVTLLDIMGGELKDYIAEMGRVHTQYQTLEANYKDACQNLDIMNDERAEHLNLSGQLATRLDDIRKSVFFEITNQLQLPVNEDEAGAMTKKIITLDTQEDAVAWNELLLAFNMMNTSKFVSRIRKKVKNAHELTRRWQKEYKDLKEKYTKASVAMHEKIAFRNFKVGDMALFLPTRNSTGNPWAAFNINAPHYFLQPSDSLTSQLHSREWIVARITSIVECVVDAQDLNTNPYGLADGLTFYQLEVEHWKNHRHRLKKKKTSEGSSSLSPNLAPADSKQISSSSLTADAPDQDDDAVTRYHRRNTVPIIHQQDIGLASITSSAFMDGPPSGDRYHSAVSSPALSQNANQTSPVSSPNVIHSTTLPFSSQSKTPAPFRRPIPTSPTDNPSPTNDIADPTIAWNFT